MDVFASLARLPLGRQLDLVSAAGGLALVQRMAANARPLATRQARTLLAFPAPQRLQLLALAAGVARTRLPRPATPPPTGLPLLPDGPATTSATAMELNAWLGQVLINLLDREQLSPARLNTQLKPYRNKPPAVAQALAQIRFATADGRTATAADALARVLDDPRQDPELALAGADLAARHAAFDRLCAQRAAVLTALMQRVAFDVTGAEGARAREYMRDPSWQPAAGAGPTNP